MKGFKKIATELILFSLLGCLVACNQPDSRKPSDRSTTQLQDASIERVGYPREYGNVKENQSPRTANSYTGVYPGDLPLTYSGATSDTYPGAGTITPTPTMPTHQGIPNLTSTQKSLANQVIKIAKKYTKPPRHFNFSSFTWTCYKEGAKKDLPRLLDQQANVGHIIFDKAKNPSAQVDLSDIQEGDLIFIDTERNAGKISLAGIADGEGNIYHAWGGGTQMQPLSTPWIYKRILKVSRPLASNP